MARIFHGGHGMMADELRAGLCGQRAANSRAPGGARTLWCVLVLFACLAPGALRAAEIAQASRLFLEQQRLALPGDLEIIVGEPDPRLKLAPCNRFEPFVPGGARLMGKTMLGVRCLDGASWSIYLPVQVKVFVSALVATRALAAGQVLGPEDMRMERVDLGVSPPGVLTDPDQAEGKTLARNLIAGQTVRRDMLRAAIVVQAGDSVRLVYRGEGFVLGAEGKATNQAAEGQTVSVRTESGKIVNGVARQGKMAEVKL